MGDCLHGGKQSLHISNTKVNSAYYSFRKSKSSIALLGWGKSGRDTFTCVGWQVNTVAGDAP